MDINVFISLFIAQHYFSHCQKASYDKALRFQPKHDMILLHIHDMICTYSTKVRQKKVEEDQVYGIYTPTNIQVFFFILFPSHSCRYQNSLE